LKVAQTLLKEKEIEAKTNVNDTTRARQPDRADQPSIQDAIRQVGGTGNQGGGFNQ
jgi:hypothetical protein